MKRTDRLADLGVFGTIILKLITKKGSAVFWAGMNEFRIGLIVNMGRKCRPLLRIRKPSFQFLGQKSTSMPLITNKCTKRVLLSIVTHSYMFRPCWVIFRENFLLSFCYRLWSRPAGRGHRQFTPPVHSTQSTAHSHSTTKCNLSVTITKSSPWRWPSRVETCRCVLQLMIKLSLCICWWLVFLHNIVHGYGTH
jgi:hypothetical protein